jgi:uncharacterized membrane protein YdfJ with MMPL/SSD domain
MPMPKGLTRRAREKYISQQLDALLVGQSEFKSQLTSFQETILMGLNKNEQDIVDAFNTSTNVLADAVVKIGSAVTAGTQAIADLFKNQSSITLADVQPQLTKMNDAATALGTAADALTALATADDPALGQTVTPITVTAPDGTVTPVSETPVP